MAIIKTQTAETATGKVKEFYDEILKIMPMIPKPLQLSSASANLFAVTSQQMKYFMFHPNLSPLLQAYIRMLVAFNTDYPYCIDLNTNVLKRLGKLSAIRQRQGHAQIRDKGHIRPRGDRGAGCRYASPDRLERFRHLRCRQPGRQYGGNGNAVQHL
jgi:hypothetical protein